MKLTVYGSRGSFPVFGKKFLEYGGNTSCYLINYKDENIIIDMGSGALNAGNYLINQKNRHLTILISHLHFDHIIGFLSFAPFFQKDFVIDIYGKNQTGIDLKSQLAKLLTPPFWPVGFETFCAEIRWHNIDYGDTFKIGSDVVTETFMLNHPNGSIGYKLTAEGKTLVYAQDNETADAASDPLVKISKGCDLLMFDSHFTEDEYELHAGWGHSAIEAAICIGKLAGCTKLLLCHHAPSRTDRELNKIEKKLPAFCSFAAEGKEYDI